MQLPGRNDPIWKDLITKKIQPQFEFFAFKLILSRLNMEYEKDPSQQTLSKCINEIDAFLRKNANLPKLQNDIEKVFGKKVLA